MLPIELNSLSSSLMLGITLYRNRPGFSNIFVAQVGYALTAIVAAIETLTAVIFFGLSLTIFLLSTTPLLNSAKWLNSSIFSLGWSITNFFLNLWCGVMIADEKSAREVLQSGNLFKLPAGAIT